MVRFLADADLNEGIVAGCLRREPTMDFLSANEANLEGVPDPDVLALQLGRIAFLSRTISRPCPDTLAISCRLGVPAPA